MEPIVYLNGRFIPSSRARITPFDAGFLYGFGLFETMRGYRGKVFAMKEHIERLKRGCRRLGLITDVKSRLSLNPDSIGHLIETLLKKNSLLDRDSYIRITLTGGVLEGLRDLREPTIFIYCKPLDPDVERKGKEGIRGIILKEKRDSLSIYKTTSYLPMILGRIEALKHGADEGIFLNERGEVTEGCTTNIFIYRKGRLITPPLDAGILPGVTRGFTIKLAIEMGIPVSEEAIPIDAIFDAEELFVTNSLIGIAPLLEVDGFKINDGRIGGITKGLQERYRGLAERGHNEELR